MKPEPTKENKIKQAVDDVHKALLENLEASKLLTDASKRKEKARYDVLKAKDRLRAIESEIMSEM